MKGCLDPDNDPDLDLRISNLVSRLHSTFPKRLNFDDEVIFIAKNINIFDLEDLGRIDPKKCVRQK